MHVTCSICGQYVFMLRSGNAYEGVCRSCGLDISLRKKSLFETGDKVIIMHGPWLPAVKEDMPGVITRELEGEGGNFSERGRKILCYEVRVEQEPANLSGGIVNRLTVNPISVPELYLRRRH